MHHCRLIAVIVILLAAVAGIAWILLVGQPYMD